MPQKWARSHRFPSGPMELRQFFDHKLTDGNHGLMLQVVHETTRKTPLTTCYIDKWCQSARQPEIPQGSFRLSIEPREKIEGNTVGYQALAPFRKASQDPEVVGRGTDGQYWLCLRDLELLYEGRFERMTGLVNTPLTHIYQNVEFIESLYPEARSNSTFPGILNLSSAQKHTVYLWIAVHRYILYLADPANAGVKKLLDEGVACEKAFPRDVYPALTGQALYRSTEALEYRGRASNGKFAELTWAQVLSRDLSEALVMSEELVAAVEKGSNEEEENGESNDAESDEEENEFQASSQALDDATTEKKRKRSVKLNWLVDKTSRSTKRRAPLTRPVERVQSESSPSQPSKATTIKLKFPPKRPPPRPHKALLPPKATKTGQEDDNEGVEKGSNSELSNIDPKKDKGEHGEPRTNATAPTAENMGTPSSPKHASEGEKKDKEGGAAATTPADPDDETDGASTLPPSKTEVASCAPPTNPPSRPVKLAPKPTSRLCRKKASISKEVQSTEQEK
ncbi:hypothetical protein BDR22DRAFT_826887 [Usnea florida]